HARRPRAREDFRTDRADAGASGAGRSVTALYEIVPAGSEARQVGARRYGRPGSAPVAAPGSDEYAFVRIRYKLPGESQRSLIARPVTPADEGAPDTEARFAAAVAALGQLLCGGEHLGDVCYAYVWRPAHAAEGVDHTRVR